MPFLAASSVNMSRGDNVTWRGVGGENSLSLRGGRNLDRRRGRARSDDRQQALLFWICFSNCCKAADMARSVSSGSQNHVTHRKGAAVLREHLRGDPVPTRRLLDGVAPASSPRARSGSGDASPESRHGIVMTGPCCAAPWARASNFCVKRSATKWRFKIIFSRTPCLGTYHSPKKNDLVGRSQLDDHARIQTFQRTEAYFSISYSPPHAHVRRRAVGGVQTTYRRGHT